MGKKSKKQRQKRRKDQRKERNHHPLVVPAAPESATRQRVTASVLIPPALAESESDGFLEELAHDEQRATSRVSLSVEIHLSSDSHFFSGLSGDISEGGIFVSTYRPVALGEVVDVEFSIPGSPTPVKARGEVRWLREHSGDQPRGVGIAFDRLGDSDRTRISEFCTLRPPLYYDDVG